MSILAGIFRKLVQNAFAKATRSTPTGEALNIWLRSFTNHHVVAAYLFDRVCYVESNLECSLTLRRTYMHLILTLLVFTK